MASFPRIEGRLEMGNSDLRVPDGQVLPKVLRFRTGGRVKRSVAHDLLKTNVLLTTEVRLFF